MRDGEAPRPRTRLAPPAAPRRAWPRFGLLGSVALHAAVAALTVVVWFWPERQSGAPQPQTAYEFRYAEPTPEPAPLPAERDLAGALPSVPTPAEATPAEPPPRLAETLPSVPVPTSPEEPPVPGELALVPPPPAFVVPPPPWSVTVLPPPIEAPPTEDAALPLPPPPRPPAPPLPRERPSRLATAAQPPTSGLFLPNGYALNPSTQPSGSVASRPAPSSRASARLPVFSVPSVDPSGSSAIETEILDIEGVDPTDAWFTAFRVWMRENWRYPQTAAVLGQSGQNRMEIVADPAGRVLVARLVTPSGYLLLDERSRIVFRGAQLPRFPAGADPNGVTLRLRMRYILIQR